LIATGLGGVVYDNTVGVVSSLVGAATHLDEIPHNLQLVGIALTHADLTAQIAAEDFGRGVDTFGKLPLDEQVRFVGDVIVAAAGSKAIAAGASRASTFARAAGGAESVAIRMDRPGAFVRTHALQGRASSSLVREIADDMRSAGWNGPPVKVVEMNGKRFVVDGHHRLAAAKRAGIDVPYEVVDPRTVIGPGKWKSIDEILSDAMVVGSDRLR
jgi:hypothetical protein